MARTFDPVDIFWVNMGGTRGFYFFRRLALSIAAILILLFLTTPAVRTIKDVHEPNLTIE